MVAEASRADVLRWCADEADTGCGYVGDGAFDGVPPVEFEHAVGAETEAEEPRSKTEGDEEFRPGRLGHHLADGVDVEMVVVVVGYTA